MAERRSRPSYGTQLYWAVWKNLLLKRRNVRSTFKELAFPIYTFVLVSLLKVGISSAFVSCCMAPPSPFHPRRLQSTWTLAMFPASTWYESSRPFSSRSVQFTSPSITQIALLILGFSHALLLILPTLTLLTHVPRSHLCRTMPPCQAEPIPSLDRTHAGRLCMGLFDRRSPPSGNPGGVKDSQSSMMPPPCLLLISPDTDPTVAQIATRVATDLRTAPVLGVMTFGNLTAAKRCVVLWRGFD